MPATDTETQRDVKDLWALGDVAELLRIRSRRERNPNKADYGLLQSAGH